MTNMKSLAAATLLGLCLLAVPGQQARRRHIR